MSNFIQEIKNHNINKALNLEMVFRTSDEDFNKSIDEVADTLNKSFLDGLVDEQTVEIDFKNLDAILEKARPHKYYKREGSPGNYKYYYTKEEYEKGKKKVEGGKEGLRINESQRKTVENKPVGSTHEHNGKKYKKQANGKWLEVSESHGLTKKEHEFKESSHRTMKEKVQHWGKAHEENEEKKHQEAAPKLSDKEYTDEEVMGGEKKYTNKDLEGYGDYKIQDHKDSIQSHIDDIKSGKDKEHNLKFIEIHKELLKRKTPDFKDAPHHQENLKKYLTEVDNKLESAKLHSEQASKLSDKEYSGWKFTDQKVSSSEDKPLKAKGYKIGDKIIYTHKGKDYPGTVKDEFDDDGIFIILDKAVWVEKEKEKGVANPMGYNNTEEPIRSFELYDGEEYQGLTINNLRKVK